VHLTPWTALLVYPNLVVSTAWVYKNLNLRLTKGEKKLSKLHFDARFSMLDEHLVNDLEPVTERAFPVIGEIKRLLLATWSGRGHDDRQWINGVRVVYKPRTSHYQFVLCFA
jgi:4-diphosphocytidyl-2C-methyl-D-erythritol kinase